ncbi:hypothetical protein PMAYCL1PPCAC_07897, partial [Pristionchus mayeri]
CLRPSLSSWEDGRLRKEVEVDEEHARNILHLTISSTPLTGELANYRLLPRYLEDPDFHLAELTHLTVDLFSQRENELGVAPTLPMETAIRLLLVDAKRLVHENMHLSDYFNLDISNSILRCD